MVNRIYPPELQLNRANTIDTLELHVHRSIARYDKAKLMKWRNQKPIPTLKTEVGKTKLTIRHLYLENLLSLAE